MKIHQGLSESRIKSSGLPPGLGYLGQQWCAMEELSRNLPKVTFSNMEIE